MVNEPQQTQQPEMEDHVNDLARAALVAHRMACSVQHDLAGWAKIFPDVARAMDLMRDDLDAFFSLVDDVREQARVTRSAYYRA